MYWKDKRVMVTGITGFIGSRIAEMLVEKGAKVSGFAQFSCVDDLQNIKEIEDKITVFRGDLTDGNIIRKIFRDLRPQVIFHMGAVTHVHYSFERPIETMRTNVLGTTNLLEACKEYPVERFVYAGSSEEYGNQPPEEMPLTEESFLLPSSPYAVSKVAADQLCQVYYESYGVPCVRARNFNSFGRKHDTNFVTEKIIYQALKYGVVKLGTQKSTRDFNHVDNVADAFIFLAEHPDAVGKVTIIASEKERTIKEHAETILKLIKEETGAEARIVWNTFPPRPNELWRLCGDMSRLEKMGWKTKLSYEEGLKKTIAYWYKKLGKQERKAFKVTNLLKNVEVIIDGFVDINAKYNPLATFKPHERVGTMINASWNKHVSRGGGDFSSAICTVLSYKPVGNSLMLELGNTSFKTFHGVNENYSKIKSLFATEFKPGEHTPRSLAVTTAVITSDNKLILGLRNDKVSTYKNHWHVMGGRVEPLKEFISGGMIKLERNLAKEVAEELKIDTENIVFSYPTALVSINDADTHSILFVTKLNLTSDEVLALNKHSDDEHVKIVAKTFPELAKMVDEKWVPDGAAAIHYCLRNHRISD